jgi:hypothetical protein
MTGNFTAGILKTKVTELKNPFTVLILKDNNIKINKYLLAHSQHLELGLALHIVNRCEERGRLIPSAFGEQFQPNNHPDH